MSRALFNPGSITRSSVDERICGDYAIRASNDAWVQNYAEAQSCLMQAFTDGAPAVLVVRSTGTEGAPLRSQFRVVREQVVEHLSDFSRDPNSDGGMDRALCERLDFVGPFINVDDCGATERLEQSPTTIEQGSARADLPVA